MTGITQKLDAAVEEAARRLADLSGLDVEIRFNSDRKTGGAYLKDQEGRQALGIRAGYYPSKKGGEQVFAVSLYVGMDRLRKPRSVKPYFPGGTYALVWPRSLDLAVGWIKQHVDVSQPGQAAEG